MRRRIVATFSGRRSETLSLSSSPTFSVRSKASAPRSTSSKILTAALAAIGGLEDLLAVEAAGDVDAPGERDLLVPREERDLAHLREVHPHRIVDALGRTDDSHGSVVLDVLLLAPEGGDQRRLIAVGVVLAGDRLLEAPRHRLFVDDLDAFFLQRRQDLLDLVRRHDVGRDRGVDALVAQDPGELALRDEQVEVRDRRRPCRRPASRLRPLVAGGRGNGPRSSSFLRGCPRLPAHLLRAEAAVLVQESQGVVASGQLHGIRERVFLSVQEIILQVPESPFKLRAQIFEVLDLPDERSEELPEGRRLRRPT